MSKQARILSVSDVTKSFGGVKAVDAISFQLTKGSVTALVGPNGAGKTTLLDVITGVLRPDTGTIHYDDIEITQWVPFQIARLGIARSFQRSRILPQMTVLDNVLLGTCPRGTETLSAALFQTSNCRKKLEYGLSRATAVLSQVDLLEKKNALASNLSHGQRRLLELARVLALDPTLLLLDEPATGLFAKTARQIKQVLISLHAAGKTILFVEHNLVLAMELAEQVLVLDSGRLILQGSPTAVREEAVFQRLWPTGRNHVDP